MTIQSRLLEFVPSLKYRAEWLENDAINLRRKIRMGQDVESIRANIKKIVEQFYLHVEFQDDLQGLVVKFYTKDWQYIAGH